MGTALAPAPAAQSAPVAAPAPAAPAIKTAGDMLKLPQDQFMKELGLSELMAAQSDAPEELPPIKGEPQTETPAEIAPAEEPPAEPAEQTPAETPAAPAEPTAQAAPAKPLAMPFQVFDEQGELEIPNLEIALKANGKEIRKPLDQIVQLASRGFYNEEREQQVKAAREVTQVVVPKLQTENQQLRNYLAAVRQDMSAMFADPNNALYTQLKAQYAAANTPEARAERAEQALNQYQGQTQAQQEAAWVQQHFAAPLEAHLTQITQAHPEVPFEEVVGRFTTLTAPYYVNGRVPRESFPIIAQLVDNELVPWVQHTHESRLQAKNAQAQIQQKKVEAETKVAKTQTILAKRQLARALPGKTGTTQTPLRETPQAPKYKKASDILADVGRIVQTSA